MSTDAADSLLDDVPAAPPAVLVPALPPTNAAMPTFAPMSALTSASEPPCALTSASEPTDALAPTVTTPNPVTYFSLDGPWPVKTDLIYVPGTKKFMLTTQHPIMRTVFHDTFENVHASLLFDCAFPDASVLPPMITDALVTAASFNVPRASNIYLRLLKDEEYANRMCRLVSLFT